MPGRRLYVAMMTTCLVMFISSWAFVRFISPTAAVVLGGIALLIPPFAVILANAGREGRPHPPQGPPDGG